MRLIFLGTGGACPSKKRNVSSNALIFNNSVILVDCGEGTQRQIQWCPFSFMKISHVLLTHFHLDHILGLFGLVETMHLSGRESPLHVIGPRGTKELVSALQTIGLVKRTFPITCFDASHGSVLEIEKMTVSSFANSHGPNSLGYVLKEHTRTGKFNREKALELGIPEGPMFGRLQQGEDIVMGDRTFAPGMVLGPPRPGRKVVFSGDTHECAALVKAARDADVLVHESTYTDEHMDRADEHFHSTARMAAQAARKAGVKHLFLTHISNRYDGVDTHLREAGEMFENVHVAEDLMEVRIPFSDSGGGLEIIQHGKDQ